MQYPIDSLVEASEGRFITITYLSEGGAPVSIRGRVSRRHDRAGANNPSGQFYLVYVPGKGYRRITASKILAATPSGRESSPRPPETAA